MRIRLVMPRMMEQEFRLLPLNLAMLAALTPPENEISIVDEAVERVNFDERVDLVGISCTTTVASRAYEIAAEYRKRGVKVVLGGTHPTLIPYEAIRHADSVCIGEAEGLWGEVLADFGSGKLKTLRRKLRRPITTLLWKGHKEEALEHLGRDCGLLPDAERWLSDSIYSGRRCSQSGGCQTPPCDAIAKAQKKKKQGMRWSRSGADSLCALRTLWLNDDWEDYWKQRRRKSA